MVLGPGGSGVSVVAAAGATETPRTRREPRSTVTRSDRHTLLVTIDRNSPAPSWAGVYRQPGVPIAVSRQLHLLTLDRLELSEQTWSTFATVLAETARRSRVALPGVGVLAGIDAAELTALPGIDDFLLLRRIRDEAISGEWQRIVVDCSGCGDPFAFLRAGSVLSQALNRFWPRHRRLAAAAERPAVAQLTAAVDAIDRDCMDIAELLTDPHSVAVHLVLAADDRTPRLAERYLAAMDLMGLPLVSVQVDAGVGRREPQDALAGVENLLVTGGDADVVAAVVPAGTQVIDRMARLRKLGVRLTKPHGRVRGAAGAEVEVISGEGADSVFELSWPQRLPDPESLRLGRSGDELLVTVCGFRHAVPLPSVLRRCVVTDARWDGTSLRVRFVPDPAVWPRR